MPYEYLLGVIKLLTCWN